ncbi:GNAT family N-acetyltransferase [soil metagenome]
MAIRIAAVGEDDLDDLLPLLRGYCDFYGVAPGDADLRGLCQALLADPDRDGLQLLARDGTAAVGFATIFWSWSTLRAGRTGTMHDLFVVPAARGSGVAEALIEGCLTCCRERGAVELEWSTEPGNTRAQAVYDRVGGIREEWVAYRLDTDTDTDADGAGGAG